MEIPVTFEPHFFPLINIEANPDYNESDPSLNVVIDSKLSINLTPKSASRFFCEQRVKVVRESNPNAPYYLDIVCLVFATIDDKVPEEERKSAATVLAHSLLFPAVRELVLSLTARQPWGVLSIGLSSLVPKEPEAVGKPPGKSSKPRTKSAVKKIKTSS